ncbi:MAG: hypothetical protein ACK5NG_10775 [Chthoniobacterales bacterium]
MKETVLNLLKLDASTTDDTAKAALTNRPNMRTGMKALSNRDSRDNEKQNHKPYII